MGFRRRREIAVLIAQICDACIGIGIGIEVGVGVGAVIVLVAFVFCVVIAVQVLITVLGTATAPAAPATAAAAAISIVLPLAIVLTGVFTGVARVLFILGAVVGDGLIVCVLIARTTTAASAVAPAFPGLLTVLSAGLAVVFVLRVCGGAAPGSIASTTVASAAVAVATAIAALRAARFFLVVFLLLRL